MENIKITIVIATYNAENYIEKALNSVLDQKYLNWECLIIDGASKDKTLSIIEEYEKRDIRIRHISEKDNGIYDAFNKGWKNAQGEWIYYLGSDDTLTYEGIYEQMKVADEASNKIGVINGGVIRVNTDNQQRKCLSKGYFGGHQGMIMRRTALEELGGFNLKYKILGDYDLFFRMKKSKYEVINTENILACFNAGGTSENIKYAKVILMEKYSILKTEYPIMKAFLKSLYDTLMMIAGRIVHNKKVSKLKRICNH